MANKITQLVNESGDNLYPLAGGMASDSITTAMLKDNSVTSDKIDWATLPLTPIAVPITKQSADIGDDGYRWCIKSDKLVVFNLNFKANATIATQTILFSGFPIPKLPNGTATRVTVTMANGADNKAYRVFVNESGNLLADGPLATGWYNGQIIYFTS